MLDSRIRSARPSGSRSVGSGESEGSVPPGLEPEPELEAELGAEAETELELLLLLLLLSPGLM